MLIKQRLVVGLLFSLLFLIVHTTESKSYHENNANANAAVTIKEEKQISGGRRSGSGQNRGRRSCDPLYQYLFGICGHWPFPTSPSPENPFLPGPRPSPGLPPLVPSPSPLVPSPPLPMPPPLVPSPPPPSPSPSFLFPSPPPPVIVFPPPLVPSPPPPQQGGDPTTQPPPLWLPPPQDETPPIFLFPPPEDDFPPMPPIIWLAPPDVSAQSSPVVTEVFDQVPP